ncbi:MAG: ComEA family DNA-binding protein [Candidatus Omnitrophica bacterium]|nr:ComEA family DNA-binding protein [Candidatus Omnitrophota bacterium]
MISLTPQEQKALMFLLVLYVCGISLGILSKQNQVLQTMVYVNEDLGKIDINVADLALLKEIPGIGEKLAMRIIEYRKEYGNFSSWEQLRQIKGIHNGTLEKIKKHACILTP